MTAQPPVKHSGIGNIRLGVTSIYGMKKDKRRGATNTRASLITTVLI